MGLRVLARIDRWAAKVNRWFGGAALAANVEQSGLPAAVDPLRVTAILGEIDQEGSRKAKAGGDDGERHV